MKPQPGPDRRPRALRRLALVVAILSPVLLSQDAYSRGSCYQWVNGVLTPGFECTYKNPQPSSGGNSGGNRSSDWHYTDQPPAPEPPPRPSAEELARRAYQAEQQRLRAEQRAHEAETRRREELARRAEFERLEEARALNTFGIEAHDRGDLEAALEFYKRALERNPASLVIPNNIAIAERAIERRRKQAELLQKDLERRRRNSLDFARVQRMIDRLTDRHDGTPDRPPLVRPGLGTDFFMTRNGKRLPGFGDPDAREAGSDIAREGIDTSGDISGARSSRPPNVEGTGRYRDDPRVVRARAQVEVLRVRRAELDQRIQQIQRDRNRTKIPERTKQLSAEADRLSRVKQAVAVRQVKKEAQIEQMILVGDEGSADRADDPVGDEP